MKKTDTCNNIGVYACISLRIMCLKNKNKNHSESPMEVGFSS